MKKLFIFILISFTLILMPKVKAETLYSNLSPYNIFSVIDGKLSNYSNPPTLGYYSGSPPFYGQGYSKPPSVVGFQYKDYASHGTLSDINFVLSYDGYNDLTPPFSVFIKSDNYISSCTLNPSRNIAFDGYGSGGEALPSRNFRGVTSVSCPNAYVRDTFDVIIPFFNSYFVSKEVSFYISQLTMLHDTRVIDHIDELKDTLHTDNKNLQDSLEENTQTIIDSNKQLQDFLKRTFNNCHSGNNNFFNATSYFSNKNNLSYASPGANENSVIATVRNNLPWASVPYSFTSDVVNGKTYKITFNASNNGYVQTPQGILHSGDTFTATHDGVRLKFFADSYPTTFTNISITPSSYSGTYQPYVEVCDSNKIDDTNEAIKEQTEATNKQTDTIKDSNTNEASSSSSSFFGDFESDDFGLSDIITMPLTFIKGLSNNKCNNLNVPIPFVDQNVSLPCMTSIYEKYAGDFLTLYQTITTGFIAYWVCINIFAMVQGFKNPDSDNVEVLDL